MRGFAVAPESESAVAPGKRWLVVVPESANQRPLYARLDDMLMSFVEEEQYRRRVPGHRAVPKAVIVSFAIQVYRELLREADRLSKADTAIPPEMERIVSLTRHCLRPILVPAKQRREKNA